jgi:uncharacterized protein YcbX
MKITELHIYPVKSLAGISLHETRLTSKGLMYDRNWMLLDQSGVFMTQRKYPKMALIQTKIENGDLIFTHKKTGSTANIPILKEYGITLQSKVWNNSCKVQKVDSVGEWFSEIFGFRCTLVFFPEKNIRTKETTNGIIQNLTSLSDKSPVLMTNTASLEELNSRLENEIPMNRFRSNIIFTGEQAYEEDTWESVKIGDTEFRTVEVCGRCKLINVDHLTGEPTRQPLEMLSTYRKVGREIKFGMRMSCEVKNNDQPIVKLGDEILAV